MTEDRKQEETAHLIDLLASVDAYSSAPPASAGVPLHNLPAPTQLWPSITADRIATLCRLAEAGVAACAVYDEHVRNLTRQVHDVPLRCGCKSIVEHCNCGVCRIAAVFGWDAP